MNETMPGAGVFTLDLSTLGGGYEPTFNEATEQENDLYERVEVVNRDGVSLVQGLYATYSPDRSAQTIKISNISGGILYKNETYEHLSVGDRREGYINRIREDGKLDLSLKKPGFSSVSDSIHTIMEALEKADGFIPCHDKSSPEKIKSFFSMSKKEFKRTIGTLYKNGTIEIKEDGISLKK